MRRVEKRAEYFAGKIFDEAEEPQAYYAAKIGFLAGFRTCREEMATWLCDLVAATGSVLQSSIREKLSTWGEEFSDYGDDLE